MNIKMKLFTFDEFRKMLVEYILNDWENATKEDIVNVLLEEGFGKLDKGNLAVFLKSLPTPFLPISTVAVDINDTMFYWVISGSSAILINKKDIDIVE